MVRAHAPIDEAKRDASAGVPLTAESESALLEIDAFVLDKERWIADTIRERIREKNKNAICVFTGETGSGKSYSALRLGEIVDKEFSLDHLVFRPLDFLDLVNSSALETGSVIVWDEMGLGMPAREWNSLFNKSIGYVLQSFRFRNLCLLMTVPDQAFIDAQARALFHYLFEAEHINEDAETVSCNVLRVEHSARFHKDYAKHPIVRTPDGPAKMRTVEFGLPSSSLRKAYEERRAAFMSTYYRELRESLEMTGEGKAVPMWAWRALLALEELTENQTEMAGYLRVAREWVNKLLRKARSAVKTE